MLQGGEGEEGANVRVLVSPLTRECCQVGEENAVP